MKNFSLRILLFLVFMLPLQLAWAQGVTTSSITGIVTDTNGSALPGASVEAVHTPSGTRYGTATNTDGRYTIPNMRVGGPYTVTVSYISFQQQVINNVQLSLGTAATFNFKLSEQTSELNEVQVVADRNAVFSSDRTGAATNISREAINTLPTINRSINDFTRLTPQSNGQSIGGQDNRLNNITVDGAVLNSAFGLGSGQPGGRTGSAPISLDAIEQIQVNVAPYDVRQNGFTGAGINAVTRSGTNEFSGSVFYNIQNENLVGNEAKGSTVSVNDFQNKQAGFRLGGPIIKNKLFFFLNGELERRTEPATQYRANRGGEPVEGSTTRVLASDLDELSSFLRTNFGYETGAYENYNLERKSDKILAKLDWNINQNHRASIRYNMLDSRQDVLVSNGATVSGDRRGNANALNFQNSNYVQLEKIHSVIGELNSTFGSRFSNNFKIGYTYQDEGREQTNPFPHVDIQNEGTTYISFGYDPYTYFNELSYSTFQLQDNFTYYAGKHTLTAGYNLERMSFDNTFVQMAVGVYTYASLNDFYTAANAYLADPAATTSPVNVIRYQQQYSALPGNAKPTSRTKVTYTGLYFQDEWAPLANLNLTAGIRADVPFFDKTGLLNEAAAEMTFRDENGNPLMVRTDEMPDPKVLWSPRLGFNWDVFSDKSLQVRGGTGIFTGRPPFVWIGNQIGQNGVIIGTTSLNNTTDIPFNPDITANYPANPTLPPTYQLNISDQNFKFPQVWKSNIAVDKSLFAGIVGTLEFIYSKNLNAVRYLDVNQADPIGTFEGSDNRLRYPEGNANRLNSSITNNYYLTNTSRGYAYSLTAQLERPFNNGWFTRVAYNYGRAKDLMSAGSTASGSYNGIYSINGSNYPEVAYSDNDLRHRVIGSVSYRKEYAGFGATQISLFYQAQNQGRFSYTYSGDMNGDNIFGNDLLYVPNSASELTFLPITNNAGTVLFTPEEQANAFDAYIAQDSYLNDRRGQYTERNGVLMPWVFRADLSLVQEFFVNVGGKRNTLQLRADVFNVGNMINSNWGVGDRYINRSPLIAAGTNADGIPQFRMATLGSELLNSTYQNSITQNDVWTAQLGIRYIFN
ncbi:carboxypeptidase regulatory-like domain-containing protein [Pontibacter silvestris]|uniref:Carboxypeptidase regulatory-like domain-containing protein n=1 Tax=Pontibacter silvestris TaxID=2305183 RepID=A0ABW4WYM3_9BACT|nr:carboxypeptidase regulatory-like domain-containing protein [Pontibacter silvestris]MCC9135649.1 carboxypeptidase regulatory-like domain-containing protein [Pontibacter silvestris]